MSDVRHLFAALIQPGLLLIFAHTHLPLQTACEVVRVKIKIKTKAETTQEPTQHCGMSSREINCNQIKDKLKNFENRSCKNNLRIDRIIEEGNKVMGTA